MGWFSKKEEKPVEYITPSNPTTFTTTTIKPPKDIPVVWNKITITMSEYSDWRTEYRELGKEYIQVGLTEADELKKKYDEIEEFKKIEKELGEIYADAYAEYQKELAETLEKEAIIIDDYAYLTEAKCYFRKIVQPSAAFVAIYSIPNKLFKYANLKEIWIKTTDVPAHVYQHIIDKIKC